MERGAAQVHVVGDLIVSVNLMRDPVGHSILSHRHRTEERRHEFDQHIVGRHPNGSAQVRVATEQTAIRLSDQVPHSTVPPLWAHGRDYSNWLEAKIQGAEFASSYIRNEAWVSPSPQALRGAGGLTDSRSPKGEADIVLKGNSSARPSTSSLWDEVWREI